MGEKANVVSADTDTRRGMQQDRSNEKAPRRALYFLVLK